MGILR